jgi:dephospho-CoA kinase
MKRPFVVGICGGIGSGKSAVARIFERLGARILDADRVAHAVLEEAEVQAEVRDRFGEGVFSGRQVDRKALASRVFGETPSHAQARADLEKIVHPRILARLQAALAEARTLPSPPAVVVIDAPLLVETPLAAACDEIVFVDAPEAVRQARTLQERRWDSAHHRARERAQPPVELRRRKATRVLDNSGSPEDLERACRALYAGWVAARRTSPRLPSPCPFPRPPPRPRCRRGTRR